MIKTAVLVLAAISAGYGIHAWAQARPDVRTAATPIGSSSSNGVSFAWFYDPNDRSVYVCRTGQGVGDAVDCRSRATIP